MDWSSVDWKLEALLKLVDGELTTLAEALGIPKSRLRGYLAGKHTPRGASRRAIDHSYHNMNKMSGLSAKSYLLDLIHSGLSEQQVAQLMGTTTGIVREWLQGSLKLSYPTKKKLMGLVDHYQLRKSQLVP